MDTPLDEQRSENNDGIENNGPENDGPKNEATQDDDENVENLAIIEQDAVDHTNNTNNITNQKSTKQQDLIKTTRYRKLRQQMEIKTNLIMKPMMTSDMIPA